MLILVTLVGAYLACWEQTESTGVSDAIEYVYGEYGPPVPINGIMATSPYPLVVGLGHPQAPFSGAPRSYYFWCFGFVAKLPYERPWR